MIAVLGLAGCEDVQIENGEIPADYLLDAKKMEGYYHGTFGGNESALTIYFDGNRPLLKFDEDPIGKDCHSKIELLKVVNIDNQDNHFVLNRAEFGFNSGECVAVKGHSISIEFSGLNNLSVKILHHTAHVVTCNPGRPGSGCHSSQRPFYITGKFSR